MKRLVLLFSLCVGIQNLGMSSLNKTHFLIRNGRQYHPARSTQQITTYATHAPQEQSSTASTAIRTYFSPEDDLHFHIAQQIKKESTRISIAMYAFTDHRISNLLIDAHKRGVIVEIITDSENIKKGYSRIDPLVAQGICVWQWNNQSQKQYNPLMHHKFAIFHGCQEVLVGSTNFTQAGQKRNAENINFIHCQSTVDKYAEQFLWLISRARPHKTQKK